jgi:hypothetical protein
LSIEGKPLGLACLHLSAKEALHQNTTYVIHFYRSSCCFCSLYHDGGNLDKKAFEQLQPHQHINAFTNKTLKAIGKEAGLKTLFEPFKQIRTSFTDGSDLKEHAKNVIKPFYRQWISTALYFQKT